MSLQLGSWDIHKKIKCPGQIWVVWYKQIVYDLVVISVISWGQQTMPAPPALREICQVTGLPLAPSHVLLSRITQLVD